MYVCKYVYLHVAKSSLFPDMGVGQMDQSMQVYHDQQAALDTMHRVLNQINQTNLVLQLGDISYARGYASVVRRLKPIASSHSYVSGVSFFCCLYDQLKINTEH